MNTSEFSSKAASFIMKLMYGARVAMPQTYVIASQLASQITKWSADSDRQLLHVYGYLHANADRVLTGTLSKSDRKHLKIIAWPDADLNGNFMSKKSTDGFFVKLAEREGGASPWPGAPTSRDRRRCTPRRPRPCPPRTAANKGSSPSRSSFRPCLYRQWIAS